MDIDDKELLYMIRQGDLFSQKIIFEKYRPLMEKFVFEVYNYCPNLDVVDIRQEMNICLFKAIDNFVDDKGVFFTYLYATINNKASNIKREYFQSHNTYLNMAIPLDDLMFSIDRKYSYVLEDDALLTNPFINYQIQETKEEFKNTFLNLSNLERKTLELYNLNCTRKQICENLNVSLKQVDNALSRAKKKIKA